MKAGKCFVSKTFATLVLVVLVAWFQLTSFSRNKEVSSSIVAEEIIITREAVISEKVSSEIAIDAISSGPPEQFPTSAIHIDALFGNSSLGCNKILHDRRFLSNDGVTFVLSNNATESVVNKSAFSPYLIRVENIANEYPNMFYRLADSSQQGVALFQNTFLHGAKSHIFNCDFEFFQGGCSYPKSKPNIMSAFTKNTVIQEVDKAILTTQHWGYGFFHHLVEDFPRLVQLHKYALSNPDTKIFAYKPSPHLIAFYNMLGIPQSQIIQYSETAWYFVKRLLVPAASQCGKGTIPSLKYIQLQAKKRIPEMFPDHLVNFEKTYTSEVKKVIVLQSRGIGKARSLTNHDSLLESLQKNFAACCKVMVHTGSTPAAEAFVMHHKATLIIGPHGAGLGFGILAQPNTSLIEIHPHIGNNNKNGINPCHQYTAQAVGLRTKLIHADNGNSHKPFTANITQVIEAARVMLDLS